MTTLLIAISAALAACVLVLLGLLVVLNRRRSRTAHDQVADVVRALEKRMDELSHELAQAVSRAEEEGRRSRFLGEIAGSIDLDEVLSRTLEAAGSLPGAAAAHLPSQWARTAARSLASIMDMSWGRSNSGFPIPASPQSSRRNRSPCA